MQVKTESNRQTIRKVNINSETGQKDWWKTLKGFIKPDLTNSIPPLSKDDKMFSDDNDKAFRDQTLLDDSQATLPQTKPLPVHKLDSVNTTPQEVENSKITLAWKKHLVLT